jgi:imidazolonepropionase-like amidohydrolase
MSTSFVLRQVHVLDEAGEFGAPTDVVVDAGRIRDVGRDLHAGGLRSVDASGLWLMPGVFDCHAHPALWSRDMVELVRTPITAWALAAATTLRATLHCGVTYVRDAGGADPGLRTAIERGHAEGPELQLSIVILGQTGGQMDGFLSGPGLELPISYLIPDYPGRPPYRADGPDEMRRAVREILRAGADWIKLCAGSGMHLDGQDWERVELAADEVSMAVAEASRARRPVMCDVKAPEAIEMCVRAGVRSIEHGLFLDEERAALMAAHGVWLVPTYAVYADLEDRIGTGELSPASARVVRDMLERSKDRVRIALDSGVRVAVGSDAFGREMHGDNLVELWHMHQAGMAARDVLLAATAGGAELCGVSADYGRIAPGYVFDAIVFDEDPSDLRVFAAKDATRAVFKSGHLQTAHQRFAELTGAGEENRDQDG